MLFLLLILPFGGLELLIIPAAVWTLGPPAWHPYLAIMIAGVAVFSLVTLVRRFRDSAAESRGNTASEKTWRWPLGMPPASFAPRCAALLRQTGWRIGEPHVNDRGRVEIIARKDRTTLALLLAGPDQAAADDTDVARLIALRQDAGATQAVLVATERRVIAAPSVLDGIRQIQFEDMARLEASLGLHL